MKWGYDSHQVTVRLTFVQVDGAGVPVPGSTVGGTVRGSWDARALGATATLTGTVGGHPVKVQIPAP